MAKKEPYYGTCGKIVNTPTPGYIGERIDCNGPDCQLWIPKVFDGTGCCREKAIALAFIEAMDSGLRVVM